MTCSSGETIFVTTSRHGEGLGRRREDCLGAGQGTGEHQAALAGERPEHQDVCELRHYFQTMEKYKVEGTTTRDVGAVQEGKGHAKFGRKGL